MIVNDIIYVYIYNGYPMINVSSHLLLLISISIWYIMIDSNKGPLGGWVNDRSDPGSREAC